MKFINISNNIITVFSFILNVLFVITFIPKIFNFFKIKIYIRKVLNFTSAPIQIYHSTFNLITGIDHINTFITFQSLCAIDNIIELLNKNNYIYNLIGTSDYSSNEINIGGFVTNKSVNAYFVKYFPNFKCLINERYKKEQESYPIDNRMIIYTKDKFGFQIDDILLETFHLKNDYAFLIKLVDSDFKNDNHRCVHILFGGSDLGTVKATEFLVTHCKQIYKKYKNTHYFFALEINRIDQSINYSKGIIDLTDKMFT